MLCGPHHSVDWMIPWGLGLKEKEKHQPRRGVTRHLGFPWRRLTCHPVLCPWTWAGVWSQQHDKSPKQQPLLQQKGSPRRGTWPLFQMQWEQTRIFRLRMGSPKGKGNPNHVSACPPVLRMRAQAECITGPNHIGFHKEIFKTQGWKLTKIGRHH